MTRKRPEPTEQLPEQLAEKLEPVTLPLWGDDEDEDQEDDDLWACEWCGKPMENEADYEQMLCLSCAAAWQVRRDRARDQ